MNPYTRPLLATASLMLATATALANPSIAPGLWEHRMTMKSGDPAMNQRLAEAQRMMASMPPEQRKALEQMMAQQGIAMAPGGPGAPMTMRLCLTPEQAAKQELPAAGERCTHRITARSANSLKFAVECPADRARGDGETVFSSPKAYEGRFRMQRQVAGSAPEQMEMQVSARWLGADCGAVKPAAK
ncbi:MAG: DUF3617 domain-containing protein [Rubrivivax sp.]